MKEQDITLSQELQVLTELLDTVGQQQETLALQFKLLTGALDRLKSKMSQSVAKVQGKQQVQESKQEATKKLDEVKTKLEDKGFEEQAKEPSATKEEVKNAFAELKETLDITAVKGILKEFGASKVSDLEPFDYEAVIKKAKELCQEATQD